MYIIFLILCKKNVTFEKVLSYVTEMGGQNGRGCVCKSVIFHNLSRVLQN